MVVKKSINIVVVKDKFIIEEIKMKKILLSMSLVGFLVGSSNAKPISLKPDHKLGEVNGEKFYVIDWKTEFLSADPQIKKQGEDKVFIPLRNSIIEKMAVSGIAKKENIDKTDAYKAEIRKAERDILTRMYFEKKIQGKISKADLQKEYREFKKEFEKGSEVKASHILVKSRTEADKILKSLKSENDFATLAKNHSKGPSAKNGGDLGWVVPGQMVPKFEKELFSLKDGKISKKPIKTQFGWHIVKREKSRKLKVAKFDDVENYLFERIKQKQIIKVLSSAIKKSKIIVYDEKGNPVK